MSQSPVVYVLDPGDTLGSAIQSLLAVYAIHVEVFPALSLFLSHSPETKKGACLLLVLDADCADGLSLVSDIKSKRPTLPLIVLCDDPDDKLREQYVNSGAVDIVSKSMVAAYLFTRLATLLGTSTNLPRTQPSVLHFADREPVTLRMISPADAEIEQKFVAGLSDRSRYLRFFSGFRELPKHLLCTLIDPQFPISYALIATVATENGEEQIAVARYSPTDSEHVAEFAVVVADEWHNLGIASQLLRLIIAAATVAGICQLEGLILRENLPMLRLAKKLGFDVIQDHDQDESLVKVVKYLR